MMKARHAHGCVPRCECQENTPSVNELCGCPQNERIAATTAQTQRPNALAGWSLPAGHQSSMGRAPRARAAQLLPARRAHPHGWPPATLRVSPCASSSAAPARGRVGARCAVAAQAGRAPTRQRGRATAASPPPPPPPGLSHTHACMLHARSGVGGRGRGGAGHHQADRHPALPERRAPRHAAGEGACCCVCVWVCAASTQACAAARMPQPRPRSSPPAMQGDARAILARAQVFVGQQHHLGVTIDGIEYQVRQRLAMRSRLGCVSAQHARTRASRAPAQVAVGGDKEFAKQAQAHAQAQQRLALPGGKVGAAPGGQAACHAPGAGQPAHTARPRAPHLRPPPHTPLPTPCDTCRARPPPPTSSRWSTGGASSSSSAAARSCCRPWH